MYYYIVQLILALGGGEALVMPLIDVGPRTLEECNSIGAAATEYALSQTVDGTVIVPVPDGRRLVAKALGYSCSPVEWFIPVAEPEA